MVSSVFARFRKRSGFHFNTGAFGWRPTQRNQSDNSITRINAGNARFCKPQLCWRHISFYITSDFFTISNFMLSQCFTYDLVRFRLKTPIWFRLGNDLVLVENTSFCHHKHSWRCLEVWLKMPGFIGTKQDRKGPDFRSNISFFCGTNTGENCPNVLKISSIFTFKSQVSTTLTPSSFIPVLH